MILLLCFPAGFRLLVSAQEEVVLKECAEILAEVFVGVQCCLGESRAVQTQLRAVVDWK